MSDTAPAGRGRGRPERARQRLQALLLLGCPLLGATAAFAQDLPTAKALFDRGLSDMEAGRYETGCKALAESQRLDPRPGTLFTLATCEDRWGHIATAATRYDDYMALHERLPDDRKAAQGERYETARKARDKLLPLVPRLTLSVARGAPPGTVVKRDGEVVADVALEMPLPVDPGEHTVSIQAPGGPLVERTVTLARGEKRTLVLEAKTAAPPGVPPDKASPPPPRRPPAPVAGRANRGFTAPLVAFGAAAIGLGVGVGAGAAVMGKRGELEGACRDKACPESQRGTLEAAKTLSYVSTGGFVLLGAGAVAGVTWLLLPASRAAGPPRIAVRPGPGTVFLEGAF